MDNPLAVEAFRGFMLASQEGNRLEDRVRLAATLQPNALPPMQQPVFAAPPPILQLPPAREPHPQVPVQRPQTVESWAYPEPSYSSPPIQPTPTIPIPQQHPQPTQNLTWDGSGDWKYEPEIDDAWGAAEPTQLQHPLWGKVRKLATSFGVGLVVSSGVGSILWFGYDFLAKKPTPTVAPVPAQLAPATPSPMPKLVAPVPIKRMAPPPSGNTIQAPPEVPPPPANL